MITVFKKIWRFAGQEQDNIRTSIVIGFIHAVFHAVQIMAVYYVLRAVFTGTIKAGDPLLVFVILLISLAGMTYAAVTLYLTGQMILPDAIMAMVASLLIFDGLKGAGSSMAFLRIAENSIDSLDYFDGIPEISEGNEDTRMKNHLITFKNVSFSYDDKTILDHISCEIRENEMTAIVGPSGSGKTTFCNLIARFWDVNSGIISINDRDIREYTLSNLMEHILMVFQEVCLFEDTIENNIKFAAPNASRGRSHESR